MKKRTKITTDRNLNFELKRQKFIQDYPHLSQVLSSVYKVGHKWLNPPIIGAILAFIFGVSLPDSILRTL